MSTQENLEALLALARARGVDVDGDSLTLAQVATLAGESTMTTRRAIWRGELRAHVDDFRYAVDLEDAASYVVKGGGRGGPKAA